MIRFEIYKIMKRKLVWVVLGGILLLVLLQTFASFRHQYFNRKCYKEVQQEIQTYEKHKGILTDERLTDFIKEYKHPKYNTDYIAEQWEIDGTAMSVGELFANVDFKIHFGYFYQWVFSWIDLATYIKFIPIFIAVAFSSVFTYEKECGMQEILLSTTRGRRECTRAKMAAAFLITNILYLLHVFLAILPIVLLTGGRGFDSSIQMTPWMMDSRLDMNYGEAFLHTFYLGFIAVNVILLITLSASFLAKSPLVAMCVSLGVLFAWRPDMMAVHVGNEVVNRITALTPLNAMDTMNLAQQKPIGIAGCKIPCFYFAEGMYSLLLVIGLFFFLKKLTKHQKYYAS